MHYALYSSRRKKKKKKKKKFFLFFLDSVFVSVMLYLALRKRLEKGFGFERFGGVMYEYGYDGRREMEMEMEGDGRSMYSFACFPG